MYSTSLIAGRRQDRKPGAGVDENGVFRRGLADRDFQQPGFGPRTQGAGHLRIAQVAIDEKGPDAEHRQRLRKVDGERRLALAVERGGDLYDLHRLRPHRPLQRKANGPDRFREKRAGFVDRVARQGRLQRRRQQFRGLRIIAAEFVASAPREAGEFAGADQRDRGKRGHA